MGSCWSSAGAPHPVAARNARPQTADPSARTTARTAFEFQLPNMTKRVYDALTATASEPPIGTDTLWDCRCKITTAVVERLLEFPIAVNALREACRNFGDAVVDTSECTAVQSPPRMRGFPPRLRPHKSPLHPKDRAIRVSSGAVAALCILTQMALLLHMVLVRHTICAEHGELVEQPARGAGAAVVASLTDAERTNAAATQGTSETYGHDHCTVCAQRRERAVLQQASEAVVPPPGDAVALLAGVATQVTRTCPIYLIAPKNSPPA